MQAKSHENKTSYNWNEVTLCNMLKNEVYIGNTVQNKRSIISYKVKKFRTVDKEEHIRVENTHEAIISKDEFNAVQQLISSRRRKRPAQSTHIFSNILICADCSHGMHFKKNRKGYICGSFNKHGIKACSSHIIREQNLKDIILSDIDFILTTISNKSFLDNISSNLNKESKSSKNKLDSIETKISKLTTRKNNALNKFIDDCISKDDYDNLVESINSELNELKSEKLLLESTMSTNLNSNLSSGMCYFKSIASNINDLTPDVVNRLIDKIEVSEDGTPRIYYRFSESSICLSDFINQTS